MLKKDNRQAILDLVNKSFKEKKRFPEEEFILKGDPKHIYTYIVNSRIKLEDIPLWMITYISTSSTLSLMLAKKLSIKEDSIIDAIATKSNTSYLYSVKVIKDRFAKGEEAIMKSPKYRTEYLNFLKTLRND